MTMCPEEKLKHLEVAIRYLDERIQQLKADRDMYKHRAEFLGDELAKWKRAAYRMTSRFAG